MRHYLRKGNEVFHNLNILATATIHMERVFKEKHETVVDYQSINHCY